MLRNGFPRRSLEAHSRGGGLSVRTSNIGYSPLTPVLLLTLIVVQSERPPLKSPFFTRLLPTAAVLGTTEDKVETISKLMRKPMTVPLKSFGPTLPKSCDR